MRRIVHRLLALRLPLRLPPCLSLPRPLVFALVLSLVLSLVPVVGAHAEEAITSVEGEHFRLVCHFDHEEAAAQGLAAIEAVWSPAASLYGEKAAPKEKLEVHLYRTIPDYEKAEQGITGGKFKRNLAFAHWNTKTAHVALQPPVADEFLDTIGLPHLTKNLLAHEAAHLVRYHACPSYRSHPGWLNDGAAMWVKFEAERRRRAFASLLENPHTSKDVLRVLALLEADELPSIDAVLHGAEEAEVDGFYGRYALRWLVFRFLVEGRRGTAFRRVLSTVRQVGGGAAGVEDLRERVVKAAAPRGMEALDREFAAWLKKQVPVWDEVYRALHAKNGVWVQTAFPTTNALAWRRASAGETPYEITGKLEILPGAGRQVNLLLDRQESGFVSIAFVRTGWVTVFDFTAQGDTWTRLASSACAALTGAGAHTFRVHVKGDRVVVDVDGAQVAEALLPAGRTLEGPWGVGAQAGTAGRWLDVQHTATKVVRRRDARR